MELKTMRRDKRSAWGTPRLLVPHTSKPVSKEACGDGLTGCAPMNVHGEVFWMIARDRESSRAYVQLMRSYRDSPEALAALLPHRSRDQIHRVRAALAILVWNDLLEAIDPQPGAVVDELRRRVTA